MKIKDKIAQDWISTVESKRGRIREADIYPRLSAWVNLVEPEKIIEIGCGQGICSDHINLENRNYTGIDPSEILINRAKQLYSNRSRNFLLGSAEFVPSSHDGIFDAAFSVSVWHLLENLQRAADELSRILKPDGNFLIISANPGAYSLWTDLYVESSFQGRRFEGKMQLSDKTLVHEVLYLHTLDEITHSLEAANLDVQSIETFRTSEKTKGHSQFISIQGKKRD